MTTRAAREEDRMDVTNHQPSEREGAWARANREELVERLGRAMRCDGRSYPLNGLMLRRESAPTRNDFNQPLYEK